MPAAPAPAASLPPLLVLTDRTLVPLGRTLIEQVRGCIDGGARAVLLREKDLSPNERRALALDLKAILDRVDGLLLIASDVELAHEVGAAGVHLAQADPLPPERARVDLMVGRSCHSIDELRAAEAEGVDYATLSPIFESHSKRGYGPGLGTAALREALESTKLPLVALGGIDAGNVRELPLLRLRSVATLGMAMRHLDPRRTIEQITIRIRGTLASALLYESGAGDRTRRVELIGSFLDKRFRWEAGTARVKIHAAWEHLKVTPVVALTIAGSDSGGGAGIQADLATFAAHGVHGCTAITALTAQNTREVRGVLATPYAFLRDQIEAVLDDLPVAAVKTGMLATGANVRVVADFVMDGRLPNLVVDPVMVSSTGARLLDDDGVRAYVELLLPAANVFTPNCREAAVLLGWDEPITTVERQREAAGALQAMATNSGVVIVKGGDLGGDESIDIEAGPGYVKWKPAPRIDTRNNHGTGCSFGAAIAARLALGEPVADATDHAHNYVQQGLKSAVGWHLGAGHGPIDHFPPSAPNLLGAQMYRSGTTTHPRRSRPETTP